MPSPSQTLQQITRGLINADPDNAVPVVALREVVRRIGDGERRAARRDHRVIARPRLKNVHRPAPSAERLGPLEHGRGLFDYGIAHHVVLGPRRLVPSFVGTAGTMRRSNVHHRIKRAQSILVASQLRLELGKTRGHNKPAAHCRIFKFGNHGIHIRPECCVDKLPQLVALLVEDADLLAPSSAELANHEPLGVREVFQRVEQPPRAATAKQVVYLQNAVTLPRRHDAANRRRSSRRQRPLAPLKLRNHPIPRHCRNVRRWHALPARPQHAPRIHAFRDIHGGGRQRNRHKRRRLNHRHRGDRRNDRCSHRSHRHRNGLCHLRHRRIRIRRNSLLPRSQRLTLGHGQQLQRRALCLGQQRHGVRPLQTRQLGILAQHRPQPAGIRQPHQRRRGGLNRSIHQVALPEEPLQIERLGIGPPPDVLPHGIAQRPCQRQRGELQPDVQHFCGPVHQVIVERPERQLGVALDQRAHQHPRRLVCAHHRRQHGVLDAHLQGPGRLAIRIKRTLGLRRARKRLHEGRVGLRQHVAALARGVHRQKLRRHQVCIGLGKLCLRPGKDLWAVRQLSNLLERGLLGDLRDAPAKHRIGHALRWRRYPPLLRPLQHGRGVLGLQPSLPLEDVQNSLAPVARQHDVSAPRHHAAGIGHDGAAAVRLHRVRQAIKREFAGT